MKRVLAGVALAATLALASCASSSEQAEPSEPFVMTEAGALGATGALLLIPAIGLLIASFVCYYTVADEEWTPLPRNLIFASCGTFALIVLIWIISTWMSVT
jgi:ABC-type phosphate/phosphonate transport system substrate-binding protein